MTGAETYVAWRRHPQAGPLIKVGKTRHVYGRMIALGARAIVAELPYQAERELLDLLSPWRVWTRDTDGRLNGPVPAYDGWSEWFYSRPELLVCLDGYLAAMPSVS